MKNRLFIVILTTIFFDLKGQNTRTTFGLQYKPIIPSEYFNSSHLNESSGDYLFNLSPKYSNSFGMVIRHKINNTFSVESGLNYTQRNYKLTINKNLPQQIFVNLPVEMRRFITALREVLWEC